MRIKRRRKIQDCDPIISDDMKRHGIMVLPTGEEVEGYIHYINMIPTYYDSKGKELLNVKHFIRCE